MSFKGEIFCLCAEMGKGKMPKEYGMKVKKVIKGQRCTCSISKNGKISDILIGDVKVAAQK